MWRAIFSTTLQHTLYFIFIFIKIIFLLFYLNFFFFSLLISLFFFVSPLLSPPPSRSPQQRPLLHHHPHRSLLPIMEVEVKLRLPNAIAHRHVTTILTPFYVTTHRQENNFFNGSSNELSSRRAILRLLFVDTDPRCVVTLKAKAIIVDGVSHVEEDEEVLDAAIGRECLAESANPRSTTTPRSANPRPTTMSRSANPSPKDMENRGERGEQRRKMKRREKKNRLK
jgi:hypothetical protein